MTRAGEIRASRLSIITDQRGMAERNERHLVKSDDDWVRFGDRASRDDRENHRRGEARPRSGSS
jgi:hypothetical protein